MVGMGVNDVFVSRGSASMRGGGEAFQRSPMPAPTQASQQPPQHAYLLCRGSGQDVGVLGRASQQHVTNGTPDQVCVMTCRVGERDR